MNRHELESLIKEHGLDDFKWIDPKDIVVSQWVRMKCRFGCEGYGTCAVCPPNLPSVEECGRFFSEYGEAALFHCRIAVPDPEDRHEWTKEFNARLLDLERAVFMGGHHKAFVIYVDPCNICAKCMPERIDCVHPRKARPSLEGLGVDVFATVRKYGYDIEVLTDYDQPMNRYGLLLIQ
jgi:predicted metal-binding protein